MTFASMIRPVLAVALLIPAGACSFVENDPNRFENLARRVAEIPVTMQRPGEASKVAPVRTAAEMGLRPANAPLRVEVMDPHELWDARYGEVQDQVAARVVEAAAPVVVQAVAREVEARVEPRLRPARVERPGTVRMVQLGAFGSEDAARQAWSRLKREDALAALSPVYEAVQVNGRRLVRLKVSAPAGSAAAVCAAARIDDPWCRRGV